MCPIFDTCVFSRCYLYYMSICIYAHTYAVGQGETEYCFFHFGLKESISLLEICLLFAGGLSKWKILLWIDALGLFKRQVIRHIPCCFPSTTSQKITLWKHRDSCSCVLLRNQTRLIFRIPTPRATCTTFSPFQLMYHWVKRLVTSSVSTFYYSDEHITY